jgi:hypothetical protein
MPWRLVAIPALVVAGGIAFLIYTALSVDTVSGNINREAERWQVAYWKKPIPPQGEPPDTHLEPARGIHPDNCGVCHAIQYQDWQGSLHSKAMGPGVTGQFPTMGFGDQASCLECHAPMSEQWKRVLDASGKWVANGSYDEELASKGMVCSACHLRRHRRHGPPLPQGKTPVSHVVHGEPLRTENFRASEFCKGCHQHPTTSMIINGKTVENTYQEWLSSPYAEQGVTCQTCHMPEGRHIWKGIHDPEMTRSGVTVATEVTPEKPAPGNPLQAVLTLTNTGTGHAFPTYTTPAVFLKAAFLDKGGNILPGGHYEERILQRRLDMTVSPWGEEFDTRVLPGESARLEFSRRVPEGAASLYLWVWVEPDHFYTGFYRAYLRNGANFPGAERLSQALKDSLDSHYLLFSRTVPIRP